MEDELLPDGEPLTEGRKHTLEEGYDHYWRFHSDEQAWAKWCPMCEQKTSRIEYV